MEKYKNLGNKANFEYRANTGEVIDKSFLSLMIRLQINVIIEDYERRLFIDNMNA